MKNYINSLFRLIREEELTESFRREIVEFGGSEKPLIVTEWKKPDFISINLFITQGFFSTLSRYLAAENISDGRSNPSIREIHGIDPITDIVAPYSSCRTSS